SGITIVADATVTQDVSLVPVPSFRLSGTVLDSSGVAVPGAQVRVVGTRLPSAVTASAGHYEFASVPQGSYEVNTQAPGNCYYPSLTKEVTIAADTTLGFTLALQGDSFGYVCRLASRDYLPATTPTGLFGY